MASKVSRIVCQVCPVRLYTSEGCPEGCSKVTYPGEGDEVKRKMYKGLVLFKRAYTNRLQ